MSQPPQLQHAPTWMLAVALGLILTRLPAQTPPVAAPVLPPAPKYDVHNPPEGVFDDQWMEVFLSGQKAGYMHQTFRRQGDIIFTEAREEYRIRRLDSVMEMMAEVTSEETVDGQPRAFHSTTRMSGQPTVVDGRGGDGLSFNITAQTGAFRDQRNVVFPEGTVLTWGQERLTRLKGLARGTTYQFPAYDPSTDAFQPLPARVVVGAREKINIRGTEIETTRVNLHIAAKDGMGGMDTDMWVDASERAVKTIIPLGAFTLEAVAATSAQALAAYLPAEIFQSSLIVLDKLVPENATSVVFRLRRNDGQALPTPPESATAHGETRPDGTIVLTLTRPNAVAASQNLSLPDQARYLARNSYLDTSDLLLRRLAAQVAGSGPATPAAVAGRLRDFVSRYITEKDLSVGFATAAEAARRREGDCTEHAVLLAALGRVLGMPARVVAGLAYMPEYEGRRAVLGFHMWTQFYLDGRWVDYDSALNDSKGPVYWRLGMVASDLNDISLTDFSLDLMSWMAGMKVSLESATTMPGK